jgi:diguanylate cyclase (GGDEF)-like protein/PAS domain S-box-containing protein
MSDEIRVQQLEQDAQRLGARLAATLESITDAFLMLDRDWRMTFINREAERLLHCKREQVLGANVWDVFPQAVGGPYYRAYHQAVETGQVAWFEEYYEPLNLWTEVRAYPGDDGLAIYFLDISQRKAQEAELHRLAFHDRLTGLPNRQLLAERIGHALQRHRQTGETGAMLFIDLDHFKSVNDAHGHEKGDQLLRLVGERLQQLVSDADTVARFGGDEFVMLLEDLGADVQAAAQRAQAMASRVLQSFAEPFAMGGIHLYSTPSVGVTLLDGGGASVEQLIKRADLAMYHSKAAGRNIASWFEPDMEQRVAARARLEADLRHALNAGQFELYYQPQCDLQGCMTGVEALLRWNHPQRGLVPPAEFIPVTEEMGLIVPLGRWVLECACALLAQWATVPGTADLRMAVNVSAQQFQRPDFVEQVQAALATTGAPPRRLVLELTESLLLKDVDGTVAKMARLRDAGVGCALDDFGTGYSSLSYLHRLPLAELKIDRSFIWDADNERNGGAIVHTIAGLGKALRLDVVAEGVETEHQRAFIAAAGCHRYQGYLYSRPMTVRQLEAWMSERQAPQ